MYHTTRGTDEPDNKYVLDRGFERGGCDKNPQIKSWKS